MTHAERLFCFSLAVKIGALLVILLLPTQFALDLQLLGGIWIEANGASLIAISSQTIDENKNVGFEVPCGWWHSSLRHHAARRAAITIVYRLYGER